GQYVGSETFIAGSTVLRQAIIERVRAPHFVRTLHGQGYRFVGAIAVQEHCPGDDAPHALPVSRGEGATSQAERLSHAPSPPLADLGYTPVEALSEEHKQATVLCGARAGAPTPAARPGAE